MILRRRSSGSVNVGTLSVGVGIILGQSRKQTGETALPVVLVAEVNAGLLPEGFLGSSFSGRCGCP